LRGKAKSEATKAKISATLTGRKNAPHSAATRAKMSAAASGRKMSPEATAKRLATRARNARPVSPETRIRMSEAQKARHAARQGRNPEAPRWAQVFLA
jgi:hypothetical protein